MSKRYLVPMVVCSYLCLVSCGTKGPLYIPEQRYPQKTSSEPAKHQAEPTTAPSKE